MKIVNKQQLKEILMAKPNGGVIFSDYEPNVYNCNFDISVNDLMKEGTPGYNSRSFLWRRKLSCWCWWTVNYRVGEIAHFFNSVLVVCKLSCW